MTRRYPAAILPLGIAAWALVLIFVGTVYG